MDSETLGSYVREQLGLGDMWTLLMGIEYLGGRMTQCQGQEEDLKKALELGAGLLLADVQRAQGDDR